MFMMQWLPSLEMYEYRIEAYVSSNNSSRSFLGFIKISRNLRLCP